MKKFYFFVVISLFCSFIASSQITVSIPASADNTIYQNPSGNSNAVGQNIFGGTNGTGSPRRGLIKFDVSALPSNAVITSVTLTLNCNLSRSTPDDVAIHKVLSAWGEGTSNAGSVSDGQGIAATTNDATWNARLFPSTLWTTAGGDYSSAASATVSINSTSFYQWSSANMIADVQSWLAAPATNFGWILICNESVISTARKFGSRENATVANRPSLTVTYTTNLPVTLSYFKAAKTADGNLLEWETLQEINNHYFEVLHSNDGEKFSPLARVNSNGSSSIKQAYSFRHNTTKQGSHFYKLAQVDYDGKRNYSGVERVYITSYTGNFVVYPNPVLAGFTISPTKSFQNATYTVINQSGIITVAGILGVENIKADILKPGVYLLCIYVNKAIVSQVRFIKM